MAKKTAARKTKAPAPKKKAAPKKRAAPKKKAPPRKKAPPKKKAPPRKRAAASDGPPDAARVARRALVLEAVAYRGFLEAEPRKEAEVYRAELLDWVKVLGLGGELEPDERRLLAAKAGTLSPDAVNLATWRSEGTAVLAWALGLHELPPYDQQVEVGPLSRSLRFLKDGAQELVRDAKLRPREDVEQLRDAMCTLTWRLRQYGIEQKQVDLRVLTSGPPFATLLKRIEDLHLIDGDLELEGRSIVGISQPEWVGYIGIAQERYQAASWLLGEDPVYSDVDTPT